MAIPSSGPISMSMFNVELGRSLNFTDSFFAGSATPTVGSLVWLASQSGSLDQNAPHSMSEWYGYIASTPTSRTISWTFTVQTGGDFSINVNTVNVVTTSTNDLGNFVAYDGDLIEITCNSYSPPDPDWAIAEIALNGGTAVISTTDPNNASAYWFFYVSANTSIEGYADHGPPL